MNFPRLLAKGVPALFVLAVIVAIIHFRILSPKISPNQSAQAMDQVTSPASIQEPNSTISNKSIASDESATASPANEAKYLGNAKSNSKSSLKGKKKSGSAATTVNTVQTAVAAIQPGSSGLTEQSASTTSDLAAQIDAQLNSYLSEGKFVGLQGPVGPQGPAGVSMEEQSVPVSYFQSPTQPQNAGSIAGVTELSSQDFSTNTATVNSSLTVSGEGDFTGPVNASSLALSSPLGLASGGTGASSLTQYGVLYGNGTGAIAATAAGSAGQCLVSGGASAPSWGSCAITGAGQWTAAGSNISYTGGNVGIGNSSGSALLAVGTAGQFQVTSSGNISLNSTSPIINSSSGALSINTITNNPVTFGTGIVVANNFSSSSATLMGGSINNIPIGATTPFTGAFTTLGATGNTTLSALLGIGASPISGSVVNISSESLTGSPTNGYGLVVSAPTGAANNYAAVFTGGNVGIGTATPGATLAVSGNANITGTITAGTMLLAGVSGLGGTNIDPVNGITGPNFPGHIWIWPSSNGYNNQLQLWGGYSFGSNLVPLTPPDSASTIYTDPTYGQSIDWNFIQDSTGKWHGAYSVCFPQGAGNCPSSLNFVGVATTPDLIHGYQFQGYVTDTRGTASFDYTPRWFCANSTWQPSTPCPAGSNLYLMWTGSPNPGVQYVPITNLSTLTYGAQGTIGGLSACTLDANIWPNSDGTYGALCSGPDGAGNTKVIQYESTSPLTGYTVDTAVGPGGIVPFQGPGIGDQSSRTYDVGNGTYYLTYDWSNSGSTSFTGTGTGTSLVATSVAGWIFPGQVLSGTGVPTGTTIIAQVSGTTGGAGTYTTSVATTSGVASITGGGTANNIRLYQTSTDGKTWGPQVFITPVSDTGGPFSAIAQGTPVLAHQGGKTYGDAVKALAAGLGNSGDSGAIGQGAYTWQPDSFSLWGGVSQNAHQAVIGHASQSISVNSSATSFLNSATMTNGHNWQGSWLTQDSAGNSGIGTVNSQNYISLGTNYRINFSSTTAYTGTQDVGIKRSAPGVLNITNGSNGLGSVNTAGVTAYSCSAMGTSETVTSFATANGWAWSSPTITATAATGTILATPSWTAGATGPFCVTYTVSSYTSGTVYPVVYDNTTSTVYNGAAVSATGTYGPILIAGAWASNDSLALGFAEGSAFTGAITTISVAPAAGGAASTGVLNLVAKQTSVNCSTSGSAIFSEPFQGASDKRVLIHLASCLGTASYTYPTAFTNAPSCYASNNAACSLVTSDSTTATTITGTTSTGALFLEDY